tara:strand:- start:824 stop:1018 length:195 start_codon:yes stop_codon:yes gene_type:complete
MNVAETLLKLEAHEKECAVRYESIQRQLDDQSARFDRIEKLMMQGFGMLATIAIAGIAIVEFTR